MRMNFSSVKSFEFEPLPVGNYLCRVVKVDEKESSTGNMMWNLRFVIQEGEFEGRGIYGRIVWVESAQGFIQQMLAGFVEPLGLDLLNIELEPDDLMRDECLVMASIIQQKKYDSDAIENIVKMTIPITVEDTES